MSETKPIQKGQRYNRIIIAVFIIGIVSLFVGVSIDQRLAGLIIYSITGLTGIIALLYLKFSSSVRLADEREQRLHEQASGTLITIVAFVGLPVVIALYLLDATGYYTISPFQWGIITGVGALYLLWGAIYAIIKYWS